MQDTQSSLVQPERNQKVCELAKRRPVDEFIAAGLQLIQGHKIPADPFDVP